VTRIAEVKAGKNSLKPLSKEDGSRHFDKGKHPPLLPRVSRSCGCALKLARHDGKCNPVSILFEVSTKTPRKKFKS
jgi:hypothetical protein